MEWTLRPWEPEDAPAAARCADNPKIARWLRDVFPSPYTLEDARAYVTACIRQEGRDQLCRAIVAEGCAAGSVGVFRKDDVYRKSAELGYWLAEPYWGCGIMTAAVGRLCREAFDRLDVVRIFAEPFADNLASRRVLEKAGFTLEGVLRRSVCKDGAFHDSCVYALLRQ